MGEGLHQIPVGPVHAGIIEPGHFRFTCNGEAVVRLEERLGYVHKGIEALLAGVDLARAARIVGRVSGDSTVAYQLAFARAVEAATGTEPPPRAVWLRALMAELERVANHINDVGFVANDAAFALLHTHCGLLREQVLRVCGELFGHRLMMDRILPGGVSIDLEDGGTARLRALVTELGARFAEIAAAYDNTPSLLDRTVATGMVTGDLARRFAAGGYVGRASGRLFRQSQSPCVPALRSSGVRGRDAGSAATWTPACGSAFARSSRACRWSSRFSGACRRDPFWRRYGDGPGEGLAFVEGFRGDVMVWVRLDAVGRVARCHPRDPSWFQWPLLEAAIEGNIVADFPLCNKSFNCSYAGHDL